MTDSPEGHEPRWELLPDRGMEFFGLQPGYDRKALKRAYNQKLRRFKPEVHPEEFRRICAAYEVLKARLRHAGPAPNEERERERTARADDEVLAQLVAGEPAEVFAALATEADPTPESFFRLAVLSDVVRDERGFAGWLIEGLRQFPSEPRLHQPLIALCRDADSPKDSERLVGALADVLEPNAFAYATDPLWLELARAGGFQRLRELYEWSWRRTGGAGSPAHALQTARVLRPLLLRAPTEWTDATLDWLTSDHALLPEEFDESIHELEVLRDYRELRPAFLDGNPVRQRIDELIHDLHECDQADADRAFLAWQVETAARSDDVLAALPLGQPGCATAYGILESYCIDLEDRLDEGGRGPGEARARELVGQLLARIDNKFRRTARCALWQVARSMMFWLPVILLCALVLALKVQLGGLVDESVLAWASVSVVAGGVFFLRRIARPVRLRLDEWAARRAYLAVWRRELLTEMRNTQLPAVVLLQLIDDEPLDERSYATWAREFFRQDFGLAIYSIANRAG